ncbi:tail fiber protein [Pseudaquabacterium pictum]|uniref:Tail protein n=1 Tax=Pseudaquabacterium pictum TaxID=2315236 RepID=A0A480ATV8_9BURK|nr:tail fiber protein [Rubrivivax pictus]GCL64300.1 tail protein [Rubrivivax pictus]
MHRIDGPAAAPGGYFTEGDPSVGTPATVVTDDWMNAVQAEIEAVATSAGAALNKADNTQMLTAIRSLIAASIPAGAVQAFARASAPTGWLVCDGATISRTAYPVLFAAIGVVFGAGDGSTTFRLPDLRGEFIRGLDGGRGVDAGRALGSSQAQQVQHHKHVVPQGENGQALFGTTATSLYNGIGASDTNNPRPHTNDGSDYDGPVNAAGVVGSETRPRNVALLYCIKT